MSTRHCPKCGQDLPLDAFYRFANDNPSRPCKECWKAYMRTRISAQPERHRALSQRWRAANPDKVREQRLRGQRRIREEALTAYGHHCVCCGVHNSEFLAIDHVNGGGRQHRKHVAPGTGFYWWLKRNGYPEDFRLLCHNCNRATYANALCPHHEVAPVRPVGRYRQAALDAYGSHCDCCGETTMAFLTIDHVNGDGATHRLTVSSGTGLYLWLKREGYPTGFRVLCQNCNLARGLYGHCPHQAS